MFLSGDHTDHLPQSVVARIKCGNMCTHHRTERIQSGCQCQFVLPLPHWTALSIEFQACLPPGRRPACHCAKSPRPFVFSAASGRRLVHVTQSPRLEGTWLHSLNRTGQFVDSPVKLPLSQHTVFPSLTLCRGFPSWDISLRLLPHLLNCPWRRGRVTS